MEHDSQQSNTVLLQFPSTHNNLTTTRIVNKDKHMQLERIMIGDSIEHSSDRSSVTSIDSHTNNNILINTTVGFTTNNIPQRSHSTGLHTNKYTTHLYEHINVLSPTSTKLQRSQSTQLQTNHNPLIIQHSPTFHDSITKHVTNTFTPQSTQPNTDIVHNSDEDKENIAIHNVQHFNSPPIEQVKKSDKSNKRKKSTTPKQLHMYDHTETLKKRTVSHTTPQQNKVRSGEHSVDSTEQETINNTNIINNNKKVMTLYTFFGKPEPISNKLQRNNSQLQDALNSSDSIESVHNLTESPNLSQKQNKHKQYKRTKHTDTDKLQQQLLEKQNELALREYQLQQKEREYEIRFNTAQKQQQQACNTQITIESLETQINELSTEYTEYQAKVHTVLKDTLIEAAILRQHEQEEKLIRDKFRIGQVVSHREGHMICDIWENGEAYREIKQKIELLEKQRDELETLRKKLTRCKRVQTAKLNKHNNTTMSDDIVHSDILNTSTEFKRPANIQLSNDIELNVEMDEVYKVKTAIIKKDLDALKDEEKKLEIMKKTLIRQQKLLLDQQNSRFNNHCIFESRYILIEMLGKGGFSEVYKAFDLKNLHYVACKIHQLNSQWSNEKKLNYTKHATREYNIHRHLSHSRVVKLFDVFAIDLNSFCTVLEYCNGNDLDYYLKYRLVLNEREARAIIMQVFSGLKYLNEQKYKIIHYDLKPGNILFHSGEVKITDFGLSKQLQAENEYNIELTSQGAGTYWYLPPECFAHSNASGKKIMISNKVDVWSCGVILYQMVVGKKPFGHGISAEQILQHKIMENARTVEFPANCKLSDVTKDFIRRCLSYNPDDRPDILTFQEDIYFKYQGFKREL